MLCFAFAKHIYTLLVQPYKWATVATGTSRSSMIATASCEYFFTQIKLALFGAVCLAFPYIATQIYKFIAPGLYRNEHDAF